LIIITAHYENGTKDATPESHARNATGDEKRHVWAELYYSGEIA
jgi:hypothetical protein